LPKYMKFPSIASLTGELLKTLRRWPLTILLAFVGTWFLMQTTDYDYSRQFALERYEHLWRMIDGCYMAMLLTIAATVFAEVKSLRVVAKIALLVLALGLGLAFYFTLPELSGPRLIRILVLGLAVHWLIAVIPYFQPESSPNGFWDYNRKLFLRSLQTMLYTLTLYLGATLALLAIDHLFGVDVHSRVYENVWWFLAGIFATIFFLAGFPRIFARPESINDYPRGLKVFTQFVLLPLVTIYLAILYAYLFKIIFTAHWPSGWVAWLVLGFAVAGIFALLLIYPLRKEAANLWINSYSRFFYLALFPLIVLLWIAIAKRIGAHGITEWRYYVLVLGVWLAVMACYFVFSARKDIRLIPASLCLLALLSLWGPWSASAVSLAAQRGRLQAILEKDGLLVGGKVEPAKSDLPLEDRKTISSITDYLVDMHGYRVFQPWFNNNLDSLIRWDSLRSSPYYSDQRRSTALLKLMGVAYASGYETETLVVQQQRIECETDGDKRAVQLDSAGYVLPDISVSAGPFTTGKEDQYVLPHDTAEVRLDSSRHMIRVTLERRRYEVPFDLLPLEQALTDSADGNYFHLAPSTMTIRSGPETAYLTQVRGVRVKGKVQITYAKGQVVLRK
jgi:Domain of unknown function (DUF4153)